MTKLKYILFLFLFLPLCAKSLVKDSLLKEALIEQGIFKLAALQKKNQIKIAEGKTEDLNFIINLQPDNATNYVDNYRLADKPSFLSTPSLEQQLNNRLQQVYENTYKECYLILISAFDVEIKASAPVSFTAHDVFSNRKWFNEQSDIEEHMAFHKDVVTQIVLNSSIISNNRDCYVASAGAYCGAFFTDKVGCYYYWFTKKVNLPNNPILSYFEETYNYFTTYLKNSDQFKYFSARDSIATQIVTAFESAAKNAKLKAQILTTHNSPDLEDILVNFTTTEDYSTLTLKERLHILKVFLTSLTFTSSENYVNKTIISTPKADIDSLLLALIDPEYDINDQRLISRLFTAIQGDNYTTFIKYMCNLVGRSTLDGYNLPTNNYNYSNLQASSFPLDAAWYRTFEWTECWNRIDPSDPSNPNNVSTNACIWTPFEKRFSNISVSSDGKIKVDFAYDSGEEAIGNFGNNSFSPIKTSSKLYEAYDLVVFINKSGIESINEVTTDGVVIVPALFLKYAYDKAFNQQIYDVAANTMTIAGIFGIDEVMLASKALSRVPKIKSMIKWVWRDGVVVSEAGTLLTNFKNTTGINAIKVTDNVLLSKVKSWQGSGSYPGIDDWEIFEIPAGTKLYGGMPGQSEFYSVEKSLIDVNFDKENYWKSLQVSPHPQFGYRPKVGEYTVNSTIKVAISKTLANPQHGAGGAWQVFVDDFSNKVTYVNEIQLQ